MTNKRFIKVFFLALALQVVLQFTFSSLLYPLMASILPEGNVGRHFLDLYVYYPFVRAVIKLGGYEGESTMIWPPVLGIALGILFYSAVLASLSLTLRVRNN
jgi:hypothetical protein